MQIVWIEETQETIKLFSWNRKPLYFAKYTFCLGRSASNESATQWINYIWMNSKHCSHFCIPVPSEGLKIWVCQYTHSLPIRNGVKSWWVRFLYFPDFWMVFVSYFPNFLWSPFLKFFIYFFEKHKFIFITKKS